MKTNNQVALPGLKPALDMLRASPTEIVKIYLRPERRDAAARQIDELCAANHISLREASLKELEKLCGNDRQIAHQGIVTVIQPANLFPLPEFLQMGAAAPLPLILALDQVKDPRNLGALARTAYALGGAGIMLPVHNSAGLSPAAFKASAGALARLSLCQTVNLARALDAADEAGHAIYGAGGHAPQYLNPFAMQWPKPLIIVLGSEESGLRPGVAKRCQAMLKIPFARSFDSLNVAQAGGMLMALCAQSRWQNDELL